MTDMRPAASASRLDVEMKVQILSTIARSIYSDSKVKIREAVANSMDNHASWFMIYADKPSRTVSLMDNGDGITSGMFELILKNIGHGMKKGDKFSNSYFGLGLMSILELGGTAKIVTKSKEGVGVLRVDVDSQEIFSEAMEDKPIQEISSLIIPRTINQTERASVSKLDGDEIERVVGDFPAHFTEIILEDIDESRFNDLISSEFEFELRKVLPLRTQEKEPFFASIKDPDALKWLMDKLHDSLYCPTVDVYLGISDGVEELSQIWKYYPMFETVEAGSADIRYGEEEHGPGKRFAYYYLYAIDDLQAEKKKRAGNRGTDLWTSEQKFPGQGGRLPRQKPAAGHPKPNNRSKNWLFGEVFQSGNDRHSWW